MLVIGAGVARGLVSIGAFVACYGLVMIVAGTVTWIRTAHDAPLAVILDLDR